MLSDAGQATTDLRGYQNFGYAGSLAEFGSPRLLPRSGGSVLVRPVGETGYRDAMGCYPLFACRDWAGLEADLDDLANDLVCVSLVADPFGDYREEDLRKLFPDRFLPFKEHFIADLGRSPEQFVSKHHRYYARRALGEMTVERCDRPEEFLQEWVALYAEITARHGLVGIKAFSRRAFEIQLDLPGAVMLRAIHAGEIVGSHFWYLQGDVAYSHLAATSPRGYELMAPYALHWHALETFAGEARWLNFGAGAGLDPRAADGLTQFKRGWSTDTRTAYFCGRIFDARKFHEVLEMRGIQDDDYFPAYRRDEHR